MALALELGYPSWRALARQLTSADLTEWISFFRLRDERVKAFREKSQAEARQRARAAGR